MTVRKIVELLDAKVASGEDMLESDVATACGSDMMSDVLAFGKHQAVLLTGLSNSQVIRTAEMMDIVCLVFVRTKKPTQDMILLAKEKGIVLLETNHTMFTSCGILYENGLRGGGIE